MTNQAQGPRLTFQGKNPTNERKAYIQMVYTPQVGHRGNVGGLPSFATIREVDPHSGILGVNYDDDTPEELGTHWCIANNFTPLAQYLDYPKKESTMSNDDGIIETRGDELEVGMVLLDRLSPSAWFITNVFQPYAYDGDYAGKDVGMVAVTVRPDASENYEESLFLLPSSQLVEVREYI